MSTPQQPEPEAEPEMPTEDAARLAQMRRLLSAERTRELLDRIALRQGRARAVLLDLEHPRQSHRDAALVTLAALLADIQASITAHVNNQPWPEEPRDVLKIAEDMREGRW